MRMTRRHLRLSLAVLWLLDGALQCQPRMFTRDFSQSILAPASRGLPSALAAPLHLLAAVVAAHPALMNAGFAIIQIALGAGLLTRRFTRIALGASIAWALMVWAAGEGFGGITTGATMLVGAPGAALLYAVLAVMAWPSSSREEERPSWWAPAAWSSLWLVGAGLQLVAGNDSSMSLTMALRAAGTSAPRWIARIDQSLATTHLPRWTPAVVIALDVLVAMWALVPGWTRHVSLALGTVFALAQWLLVQGLGDLTSGQSTDPNCGPLIVLLAWATLSAAPRYSLRHPHRRASVDVGSLPTPVTSGALVAGPGLSRLAGDRREA